MKTYRQQQKEKYKQSLEIVSKGFRSPTKLRQQIMSRARENEVREQQELWWAKNKPTERVILKEYDKSQFKVGDICLFRRAWYLPDFDCGTRVTVTGFFEYENIFDSNNKNYSITCSGENHENQNYIAEEAQLTKIIKKILSPEALATINEIDPYGEDIWDE